MIKAKVDGPKVEMAIKGSLNDICSETLMIVRNIWESIAKQDEEFGEHYKELIERAFEEKVAFADHEEMAEIARKAKEKVEENEDAKKELKQALKELKEVLGELFDED